MSGDGAGGTSRGGDGAGSVGPAPDPVPDEEAIIVSCKDGFRPNSEVKHGVIVDGEQYSDRCTSAGHLQEIGCDGQGQVTSTIRDCDGRCIDGTCESLCASKGNLVRISRLEGDGRILLENTEDDQRFLCLLGAGTLATCVDAFAEELVEVNGVAPLSCTGGTVGTIAVLSDNSCQFIYCTTYLGDQPNPLRPTLASGAPDCPTWGDSIETVGMLETGQLRLAHEDVGREYVCDLDLDELSDISRDPEPCRVPDPATVKSLTFGTDEENVAYYCTGGVPFGFSTCCNAEAPCRDANCIYTNCSLLP